MVECIKKYHIDLLNSIFEIEKRLVYDNEKLYKQLTRMKRVFESCFEDEQGGGLFIVNPIGERYEFTRTDCDASLIAEDTEQLFIRDVLKPILVYRKGTSQVIIQKGLVIVSH